MLPLARIQPGQGMRAMTGTIRQRFDSYGFIKSEDGRAYFFHDSDLVGDVDVEEGDRVAFDPVDPVPVKGLRARNVSREFSP